MTCRNGSNFIFLPIYRQITKTLTKITTLCSHTRTSDDDEKSLSNTQPKSIRLNFIMLTMIFFNLPNMLIKVFLEAIDFKCARENASIALELVKS